MKILIKISFLAFLLYFSCENNPATYDDCNGIPNGPSNEDNCGICDNDPLNDCIQDCAGVWGGHAEYDECENCNDNPANNAIPDCNGNCIENTDSNLKGVIPNEHGSYIYDGMDCTGTCGGELIGTGHTEENGMLVGNDECGRCNGEGPVYICGCEDFPEGESFVDSNGNGFWDKGEVGDENNFIDLPNYQGEFNQLYDPPEQFEDLNNNGVYDAPPCDCYGNVRDCWYDSNGDNIQNDNEPGIECPYEYNLIS